MSWTPRRPLGSPSRDAVAFRKARQGGARAHAYVTLLGMRTYDATNLLRQVERGSA